LVLMAAVLVTRVSVVVVVAEVFESAVRRTEGHLGMPRVWTDSQMSHPMQSLELEKSAVQLAL